MLSASADSWQRRSQGHAWVDEGRWGSLTYRRIWKEQKLGRVKITAIRAARREG